MEVFEKQCHKNASKNSKLQKNYEIKKIIDYNDVMKPSDDVITFGTKFLKDFGDKPPSR